ncbi:MAG: hypothetical protein A2Y34_15840 [Spirochaetes bacterium GWC1_27_15]|nr:MAG: hypothetical protein A2Z98_04475 [Spirochaetes bacterium GWB1_27_13]OHD27342.1 MAG: hypothetical protein A2Y34_15840 [Spirochaetes bacterium GWC1_27_15]
MIAEVFKSVTDWYMANINYFTITGLMAIESSFIPFPSEIIIPPAAWKAAQGDLNIFLVVIFGTLGAIIGALFNYLFALFLGRAIIYKFADTKIAHFLLIDREGVKKAEDYFLKYGNISTFIGRLVPGVRQLISVPAGLSKMKILPFLLYTTLGATIWNVILAVLGYFLYSQKELLNKYYKELSYVFLILGVLVVAFIVVSNIIKHRKKKNNNETEKK